MAIATIKLKYDKTGALAIPVTFINPNNKKSIVVDVLPDTGYTYTTIENKSIRTLALDEKLGKIDGDDTVYALDAKVGNLTPIRIQARIPRAKEYITSNVLGIVDMHKFFKVTFTSSTITFEDRPAAQVKAAFVMGQLQTMSRAGFRNRL